MNRCGFHIVEFFNSHHRDSNDPDTGGSENEQFPEGMFRFEHIIDAITKLYETNLNSEFSKMRRRISTKTSKYTKKYHK